MSNHSNFQNTSLRAHFMLISPIYTYILYPVWLARIGLHSQLDVPSFFYYVGKVRKFIYDSLSREHTVARNINCRMFFLRKYRSLFWLWDLRLSWAEGSRAGHLTSPQHPQNFPVLTSVNSCYRILFESNLTFSFFLQVHGITVKALKLY